jgi:hypothetical protein
MAIAFVKPVAQQHSTQTCAALVVGAPWAIINSSGWLWACTVTLKDNSSAVNSPGLCVPQAGKLFNKLTKMAAAKLKEDNKLGGREDRTDSGVGSSAGIGTACTV